LNLIKMTIVIFAFNHVHANISMTRQGFILDYYED
jgi:hypothetical protein